ncbi:hypothetical protein [Actinokineospora sp. NPDC004072]
MSKWISAAGTVLAAVAIAVGGVFALTAAAGPDRDLDGVLRDAPAPNGSGGVVDYGIR